MAEQNSTMANFGGRYTCPDCDVDGAVDVRRVAPELRVNGFPLATSAYGLTTLDEKWVEHALLY
jgi:hypothetical protein